MNDLTHQQLLRDYAERRSEAAFAELLRRHVDLVYSAALRILRDPHLAEDVTQNTFLALAHNAGRLADRPVLSGWLHRTVRNLAANAVRSEVRRRAREQEAAAMNQPPSADHNPVWHEIASHLDATLGGLSEADRDALLLRYFERKSAREMAQAFQISEEAAQKRVARAVDRLRELFAKRGITMGANGLAVLLGANAVQAAPAALAGSISAALATTALSTAAVAGATSTLAMTTLQKAVVTTVLTAALGAGVYQTAQNSTLHSHVRALEQQQGPFIQQLQRERDDAAAQLAAMQAENTTLKSNQSELLQLRNEVARLRGDAARVLRAEAELAQLKSRPNPAASAPGEVDPVSGALHAFLGEAVPAPPDLAPAYTREGLLAAVQQAAQLAGVSLKKLEIDTSEFPFLLGVVCESEADFSKVKAQFANMPDYEYQGGTGSHGSCAFGIIPYRSYPSDAGQRISHRTMLRTQVLAAQLRGH